MPLALRVGGLKPRFSNIGTPAECQECLPSPTLKICQGSGTILEPAITFPRHKNKNANFHSLFRICGQSMTKFCLSELSALAGSDVDPGLLLQWRTNTRSDDFAGLCPATLWEISAP